MFSNSATSSTNSMTVDFSLDAIYLNGQKTLPHLQKTYALAFFDGNEECFTRYDEDLQQPELEQSTVCIVFNNHFLENSKKSPKKWKSFIFSKMVAGCFSIF